MAVFRIKERRIGISALVSWADTLLELAFFSMQTYLTDVWNLSFTHAAAILNIWGGISWILPVFFLFLADALIGHFKMIVISSIASCLGIALVTMSTPPVLAHITGTCKENEAECIGETQRAMFYTGMALLAVGFGGHRASLSRYSDEAEAPSPQKKFKFRDLLLVLFFPLTTIAGFFAFPYIKQWYLLFGVPGLCVVCATLILFCSWNKCNSDEPKGSPLIIVCRVCVAAARKTFQPFPLDAERYLKDYEYSRMTITDSWFLRALHKAAIILPDENVEDHLRNKWRLCTVAEVEIAKFVARVIPIGTTCVVCTIVSSVGNTFLVEQGSHMNRNLGKWKVPSQVLLALFIMGKKLFDKLAGRFVEIYGPPWGIPVAMMFSALCCATAAVIEIERLKVVKRHGLVDKPDEGVPMAAYWLFFPFFLLAGMDSFFRKSLVAFYEFGSPNFIKPYCVHFTNIVSGLGLVYTVLSVYVVGKISENGGRQSWFQDSLNKSRLDRYYWVMAGLSALNLLIPVPLLVLNIRQRPSWKAVNEYDDEEEYNVI